MENQAERGIARPNYMPAQHTAQYTITGTCPADMEVRHLHEGFPEVLDDGEHKIIMGVLRNALLRLRMQDPGKVTTLKVQAEGAYGYVTEAL